MKNKSILSVLYAAYGSNALVIVALLAMSSVCAKQITPRGTASKPVSKPAGGAVGSTQTQKQVKEAADVKAAAMVKAGLAVAKPTTEGNILMAELVGALPWSSDMWAKFNQNRAKLTFNQQNWLMNAYEQIKVGSSPESYWQNLYYQQQMMQQQPQIPFSTGGVATGVGMLASQGMETGKGVWEGIKGGASRLYQSVFGEYSSALGNWKYALPGAALAVGTPVGWLFGAGLVTSALMSGGSAATILALTAAMERANMAGQTGGHVSKASFLESVKEQLILVLSNEAAYPFFTSKIEALTSNTELYPIVIDQTGVARQAHNELLASNTSQYQISANSNPALAERETKFNDMVKAIRQKYKYNESDQYIKNIETDDLLQAQALVSEYNRALNRKRVQLIVAEKS